MGRGQAHHEGDWLPNGRCGSVLTRLRLDYTLLRFLSLAATPEPLVHADQLLSDEMRWAVLLFRSSSLLLAVTF